MAFSRNGWLSFAMEVTVSLHPPDSYFQCLNSNLHRFRVIRVFTSSQSLAVCKGSSSKMAPNEQHSEEYAPLYADRPSGEKRNLGFDDVELGLRRRQLFVWQTTRVWLTHLILIAIYTTIFVVSGTRWKAHSVFSLVDCKLLRNESFGAQYWHLRIAPANVVGDETHLEIFPIQGPPHGIYTGEPRPEVDKAWKYLLRCTCVSAMPHPNCE